MSTPVNTSQTDADSWGSRYGDYAKAGSTAISEGSKIYSNAKSAKEQKRRNLARIMQSAMNRNQDLSNADQEYQNEMSDFQSQAMQQVARGFVSALQGSSRRGAR